MTFEFYWVWVKTNLLAYFLVLSLAILFMIYVIFMKESYKITRSKGLAGWLVLAVYVTLGYILAFMFVTDFIVNLPTVEELKELYS